MDKAIEVQNLHKAFGERKAVQGVSFEVEKGEISACSARTGPGRPPPSRCSPACCAQTMGRPL